MTITVKEPFELRTTLAVMKSAKGKGGLMNVWDQDIKVVEDALAIIDALRLNQQQPPKAWTEAKKEIDDGWPNR